MDLILRRVHLFLGLFLAPWFLMYAISSVPFNHNAYFEELDKAKGLPASTTAWERDYDVHVPANDAGLKLLGDQIMADAGLEGTHGTYRVGSTRIEVYVYSFWRSTTLRYNFKEKKLSAHPRRFRWDHFFTGMHAKGGYEQDRFVDDAWAVIVDLVCVGMFGWILTGLYLWWGIGSAVRRWGAIALGAGVVLYAAFLLLM